MSVMPQPFNPETKTAPKIALILREDNQYYFCRRLNPSHARAIFSRKEFTTKVAEVVYLDTGLGQETISHLTRIEGKNVPWALEKDLTKYNLTGLDVIVSRTEHGDLIIDHTAPDAIAKVMSQATSAHPIFICTPRIPEDLAANIIYRNTHNNFTTVPNTVNIGCLQRYLTAFPQPEEGFYFQSGISLASAQQYLPYLRGKYVFLGDYSTWKKADYISLAQSVPRGTWIVFSQSIKQEYAEAFLAALTQRDVRLSLSSTLPRKKADAIERAYIAYLSRIKAPAAAYTSVSPAIPSGYFGGSSASASSSSAAASHPASPSSSK